ncbi:MULTISPECIES: sigma-70 family RNA polymerase sigma factor [Bacillus cereus group]|uniref:sigma-70 family RNA polymerase sigma factor n=1 Tax=Bacillus cereus group TaxID=86661 RepID=UPI0001A0C5D7|nr:MULTISPECIES: sigma-70 family RNA polymerase sigma factor [Bacillus cereus group]EEL35851.1 RNA polymerase sigma-70 factor, ECF subfamily [Bacillus cereus Rock3-28]
MDELTVEMFEIEDKEDLIDEIMNKYGQEALQLVYSYVNNKEVAEDLTQDIFVKCYKSLHTYKGNSNLKTWLWRIAINHCKDYLKSWYNKKVIVTEDDFTYMKSQKESVEQTVIQNAEDSRLASAVMNLPIKYREVIYLFYYEELAIKEIATISLPFISYGLTPTVFHALLMGIVLSVYRRKDMSFRMKRTP